MSDRIAVITGASKGIGRAIAQRFSRGGYKIVNISFDEQNEADDWTFIKADLASPDSLDLLSRLLPKYKKIDCLINNAGIAKAARIEDAGWDDARRMMDVNFFGTFFMIQQCIPLLRENAGGVILNVTSISGVMGFTTMGAYCASKFAVSGLSLTAAKELAKWNIRVNCICPGPTDTDMWTKLDVDYKKINGWETETESEQAYMNKLLIKRLGHPNDVADAAEFLASDKASYITGINFKVCGGNSIG